jgi:sugar/nucleoside kinase (ribokinase family)
LTLADPAPKGEQVSSSSSRRCDLCVAGLVYFEVHAPVEGGMPPSGQERFVGRLPVTLGGALNTASVAKRLGLEVTLVHPSGGTGLTDVAIRQALAAAELPSVTFPSRADPALSLVFSDARDRGMLSAADFEAFGACPALPAAGWIHVPGLCEARLLGRQLDEARAAGARIAVSGSFAPEELARLRDQVATGAQTVPLWDLLVLNEREAQALAGSAEAAIDRLRGLARELVVTLGDRGVLGLLGGEAVRAEAAPLDAGVETLDPTGAGDAFCAGLLAARVRGWTAPGALRFATRVAARILGVRGGAVLGPGVFDDLQAELQPPLPSGGEP